MRILIVLILSTIWQGCNMSVKDSKIEKETIQLDSIDIIYFKKRTAAGDSIVMTENQSKIFADYWNRAKPVGLIKYLPEYTIKAIMKDNSVKTFRVRGTSIKDDKDWTYDFGDSAFFESMLDRKHNFPTPSDYSPIEFINTVSQKLIIDNKETLPGISMIEKFPKGWVKFEHIETLMSLIDNKDSCGCYLNPMSSYLPTGYGQKGGFAALFIESYKNNEELNLGLYLCPKIDENLNAELKTWWKNERTD